MRIFLATILNHKKLLPWLKENKIDLNVLESYFSINKSKLEHIKEERLNENKDKWTKASNYIT